MIRTVEIENYKSTVKARFELGRVNVLIGENGAGKSNVVEAIALGAAAATERLEPRDLAIRGIRVSESNLMTSAFDKNDAKVKLAFTGDIGEKRFEFIINYDQSAPIAKIPWLTIPDKEFPRFTVEQYRKLKLAVAASRSQTESADKNEALDRIAVQSLMASLRRQDPTFAAINLNRFLTFSPEYSTLRMFREEAQTSPIGIRGEGLFSHLQELAKRDGGILQKVSDELNLIDWFDGFEIPNDLAPFERTLRLRDRYLVNQQTFDQRSVNEGFLFLLFYFTLLISPDTPKFFAIDNVETSLNPKLCIALIRRMVKLAEEHGKQLILTTHNPAILDGLDLNDDEQRLFVVSRDSEGRTRLQRIPPPKPIGNDRPLRLSEAFLKGYIGGLPDNF